MAHLAIFIPSEEQKKSRWEEAKENGFFVSALQNPAGIVDENTNPVRTNQGQGVVESAWNWFKNGFNLREHSTAQRLSRHNPIIFPNQGITRPNVQMMNPEGTKYYPWANYTYITHWNNLPDVNAKYHTEYPYPYPNNEYYGNTGIQNLRLQGNPWKMGGRDFTWHNTYRNPHNPQFENVHMMPEEKLAMRGDRITNRKKQRTNNKATSVPVY
jgi:hypothetical protein